MANLRPFKAARPVPDKVHLVASRSYVSYSRVKLRDKLEYNPYSFIHIINPEFGQKSISKPNTRARFRKVRERYESFLREGIFLREEQACFYLYRQWHDKYSHTGIIAGVSADDYLEGHVKIHEHSLAARESMFKEYLDETNFNAEPVLLTFKDSGNFHELLRPVMLEQALYDFTTADKVRHQLWKIELPERISQIQDYFKLVPNLYIGDGHHRCASSVLLASDRKSKGIDDAAGYFMSYLVPSSDISIHPFHRLVTDLGTYSEKSFLEKLQSHFDVKLCSKMSLPVARRHFSLYLEGHWYSLDLSAEKTPENLTDAQVLTDLILAPLLQIVDLRHDQRISFLGGSDRAMEAQSLVDKGQFKAAFLLFPVSPDELMAVSDRNEMMPPKSTWVQPKLRSGLTIYELDRN
jgi:uncharacterized protein (DUF1015 family)